MAQYVLQIIFFQLIFLLAYELLLKKETFFTYNRWYLLLTPILSLLLPLLKLESLATVVPVETMVLLPEVIIGNASTPEATNPAAATATANSGTNLWWLLYAAGAFISLLLFLSKYRMILKLSRNRIISKDKTHKIIEVRNSNVAFTFFNTIYLGDKLEAAEREQILSHEMVHVTQKHSFDLAAFEILRIALWFNPLVYLYQSRIATLHEYIADAKAVNSVEKSTYYQQLLNTAFSTKQISFINQFFNHSLIKKRIVMLQKSRSKTISKFKYLILAPLLLAMLTYVSCSQDEQILNENVSETASSDEVIEIQVENLDSMTEDEKALFKNTFSLVTEDHASPGLIITDGNKTIEVSVDSETGAQTAKIIDSGKKPAADAEQNSEVGYVPFLLIDESPVFPGCEDASSNSERKDCLTEKINSHIGASFNTNLGKELNLKGINRVNVQFAITKAGNIEIHGARGPAPELEEEARRVLSKLPKMTPGKHRGEEVAVLYSLPIVFKVGE